MPGPGGPGCRLGWRLADGGLGMVVYMGYECPMHDHRRLEVYGQALDLAETAYGVARALPDIERFELSSQIRRASTSIAVNIAEGAGRNGPKEFAHFLGIAIGSACEVDALMDLVVRLYPEYTTAATTVQSATRPLINRLHQLERHTTH